MNDVENKKLKNTNNKKSDSNIKDNNLINTAVSSVDTYLSTTGTTDVTS